MPLSSLQITLHYPPGFFLALAVVVYTAFVEGTNNDASCAP